MTLTPGKYAARLGISIGTLQAASKRLHMPWQPGMSAVDVELMDAAWQAAFRRGAVKSPIPGGGDDDAEGGGELEAAKLRKAKADADLVELKVAKLSGALIPVDEVTQAWLGITAGIDAMLDALPAKIAAGLGGDKREIMRVVRAVVAKERDGLAARIEADARDAEAAAPAADDDDDDDQAPPAPVKRPRGRPRKHAP